MSFEEKLVELVRENTILYDLRHEFYRRTDVKDKIWREIALKLKSKESICKTRWKSLRDTYRKARRVEPSGSAALDPDDELHKKKWKYYQLMTFLDNVEDQGETVGNFRTFECTNFEDSSYDSNREINENVDLEELISNSSTPAKKRKVSTSSNKDIMQQDFSDFLDKASKAISEINSVPTKQSSTSLLFSSLAMKIENANLPSEVVDDLEVDVSNLVYNRLREHKTYE